MLSLFFLLTVNELGRYLSEQISNVIILDLKILHSFCLVNSSCIFLSRSSSLLCTHTNTHTFSPSMIVCFIFQITGCSPINKTYLLCNLLYPFLIQQKGKEFFANNIWGPFPVFPVFSILISLS